MPNFRFDWSDQEWIIDSEDIYTLPLSVFYSLPPIPAPMPAPMPVPVEIEPQIGMHVQCINDEYGFNILDMIGKIETVKKISSSRKFEVGVKFKGHLVHKRQIFTYWISSRGSPCFKIIKLPRSNKMSEQKQAKLAKEICALLARGADKDISRAQNLQARLAKAREAK